MNERFDNIIREYIDFVNGQVGTYMDALAGFAGHYSNVQRQVHRILHPASSHKESEETIVVCTSYEDPAKPDIVLNRITRAKAYLDANSPGGLNEQRHAQAIVIFLFTFWEDEIRPRLARAKNTELNEIRSDIMGDMRILRHAILHAKGVIRADEYKRLKVLSSMFQPDRPLHITYEDMHRLFILIKQDCCRLMFQWLEVKKAPVSLKEIVDVGIPQT